MRHALIAVTVASAVAFTGVLYAAIHAPPPDAEPAAVLHTEEDRPSAPVDVAVSNPDTPVRLAIPTIAVDAAIVPVGIARSGNMAVPRSYQDVAWYKLGPAAGENGNAVFAGHLDNALGLPGVFDQLATLDRGDEILVTDTRGHTRRFTVTDSRAHMSATPPAELFATVGPAQVILITCEGAWDQELKQYTERRIVTASLARAH